MFRLDGEGGTLFSRRMGRRTRVPFTVYNISARMSGELTRRVIFSSEWNVGLDKPTVRDLVRDRFRNMIETLM